MAGASSSDGLDFLRRNKNSAFNDNQQLNQIYRTTQSTPTVYSMLALTK